MAECKAAGIEQRFFLCVFTEIDFRFIGLTGNFLLFPSSFSVPGYSVKGPINSTR